DRAPETGPGAVDQRSDRSIVPTRSPLLLRFPPNLHFEEPPKTRADEEMNVPPDRAQGCLAGPSSVRCGTERGNGSKVPSPVRAPAGRLRGRRCLGWTQQPGARRAKMDSMIQPPNPHAALGPEPIRTIGKDELKSKLDRSDDFRLVMALNSWAYDAKHIPGSVHFNTPEELYAAIRPDDEIVVYCSNVDCLSSVAMYRDLVQR